MTLQEFRPKLAALQTLEELDAFLREHLPEIRLQFYGLTSETLQEKKFYFEDAFSDFTRSGAGCSLSAGSPELPATVRALMVLFLSLFQRADLEGQIQRIVNLLPQGSLRRRARAIVLYKDIKSSQDYLNWFEPILEHISEAQVDGDEELERQCEDMVIELVTRASTSGLEPGTPHRTQIFNLIADLATVERFPILGAERVVRLSSLTAEQLLKESHESRLRLAESLHREACNLVPDLLFATPFDEGADDDSAVAQPSEELPDTLGDILIDLGAIYHPSPDEVAQGLDADEERNRIYLGTYFPRTVVESWNIISELLTIPAVRAAFRGRDPLRILDIGSGTGGAVVGSLLGLSTLADRRGTVSIHSFDGNEDALAWQGRILQRWRPHCALEYAAESTSIRFGTTLDEFSVGFVSFVRRQRMQYDLVLFWKCLSEFYNANYALAIGTIQESLETIAPLMAPHSLCILADVTSKANGFEYFPCVMNREANAYEAGAQSALATVCPVPCARHARSCEPESCFTQRRFSVRHALCQNDQTRISYRVFAPTTFAETIVASFPREKAYRVNAARPQEVCAGGQIRVVGGEQPSGYELSAGIVGAPVSVRREEP